MLKAFREDGTEVLPGEPIKDFRGDPAVFVRATRAPGNGCTGKIKFYTRFWTAADARRLNWARAGQPNTAEVYMGVYSLTVREVPDPEPVTLRFPGFPPVRGTGPAITAIET